jgi:ABC-type nitrate/sulfonate/bicarbonate transport system ATPase subunit/ubiquinone/menaquinone biosynthesis C-methylase UbiE
MTVTSNPLLELNSVSVTYVGRNVRRQTLDAFSFKMHPGDLVVIMGNSGTGKSTLLDVIAGFIRPSSIRTGVAARAGAWLAPRGLAVEMKGTVYMDGQDVTLFEPRERHVGLMMQRFNLYPHMNVRKNLEFPLKMKRVKRGVRKKLADEKASLFGITEHLKKSPNELSVGEQQRVAIAKMLLSEPRIALFDEAFSNLNWELRDSLYANVVKQFVADGDKGVVFVSHNLLDAVEANKILYMKREDPAQQTEIMEFPRFGGNAWTEFESFLTTNSKLYTSHREKYARVFGGHNNTPRHSVFGHRVYSPADVLHDTTLSEVLKTTFLGICRELSIASGDSEKLTAEIWKRSDAGLLEFEERLQECVKAIVPPDHLQSALRRRSQTIAEQVRPFLVGSSLADIGCGDGLVAWHVKAQVESIVLTDVHSYLDERIKFPFYAYSEGEALPLTQPVDTSLLLTVLHHSEDPIKLLMETKRVTRHRAIVIESVFGVSSDTDTPKSVLRTLDIERQLKYQTFLDWLYNRVFHDGVPVPFNFNTPKAWQQIFTDTGWEVERAIDLGVDQAIVPEHHFLFVLKPIDA